MEHIIQREILIACSFCQTGAKYSELKPKNRHIENDLFNYHLKQLVKNSFLSKQKNGYVLTELGKSTVTNIDWVDKDVMPKYKVSTYLAPVIGGKILLYKRLKHPQYGYTGLISGKITTAGKPILENAKSELKEEANLEADFKIIGNLRQIRRNKEGAVIEDGIFYVCYTDKFSGNLTEKSPEGEYFWVPLEKVSKLPKIFKPSLEICVEEIIKRLKGETSWENKFIYELQPEPEEY